MRFFILILLIFVSTGCLDNKIRGHYGLDDLTDDLTPKLSINNVSASEGSSLTFTVTSTKTFESDITFSYTTTNGTALSGTNYTTTSGNANIPAGQTTTNVIVPSIDTATMCEGNRTFDVVIYSPMNATILDATGTGTVQEDDAPNLSIADSSAAEGAGVDITATLSAPCPASDVTFTWSNASGTSLANTDFTSVTNQTVTITAGNTTATLTTTSTQDTLDEDDETFDVTISSPVNANITAGTAEGTITDNDAAPDIGFSAAAQTLAEGVGAVTVTTSLSTASGKDVSVPFTVTGTATGTGTDHDLANGTITILAGQTSTQTTFNIIDDASSEVSETVILTLGVATNGTAAGNTVHTVTITDNDPVPNVTGLTANPDSNSQITLSWTSGGGITDDYRISYQTGATAPTDCTTAGAGITLISAASITGITHAITGLTTNTQYSFRVCAIDASTTNSSTGTVVTATTLSIVSISGFAGGTHTNTILNGSVVEYDSGTFEISSNWMDTTGLVAYWKMDDTGGTFTDATGNGHNSGAINATTVTQDYNGKIKKTAQFAPISANTATFTTQAISNDMAQISISAWIYPYSSGMSGWGTVLQHTNNSCLSCGNTDPGWWIGYGGNANEFMFKLGFSTTDLHTKFTYPGTYYNGWHHIVLTWDGTATSSTGVQLYIDGVAATHISDQDGVGSRVVESPGINYFRPGFAFNGLVDDISLWSRVLTSTEASDIYNRQNSYMQGNFLSQIFDAGATTTWASLEPVPKSPYIKALTSSTETAYTSNNFSTTGLIAHYKLDGTVAAAVGTAANGVVDSSSLNNHGTLTDANANTTYQTGKINQAVQYDGVADYIDLSSTILDNLSMDEGTFSTWIYRTFANNDTIYRNFLSLGNYSDTNRIQAFYNISTDQWNIGRISNSSSVQNVFSADSIPQNQWTHVAMTWSVTANQVKTYINGTRVGSILTAGASTQAPDRAYLGHGWYQGAPTTDFFIGMQDETSIYSRPLSEAEINSLYMRGANSLKYQVRACDDAACAGDTFVGPSGAGSYFTEMTNPAIGLPTFDLSGLGFPATRYMQYKVFYDYGTTNEMPALNDLVIKGAQ